METKEEYNGMRVGDLITTYHKGFRELTLIQVRRVSEQEKKTYSSFANYNIGDEKEPLFHYKKIFDESGKLAKKDITSLCDASFCKPAKQRIDALLKAANDLEEAYSNYNLQKYRKNIKSKI